MGKNLTSGFERQTGKLFGNMVGNAIASITGLDQSEHRTYHNASREQIAQQRVDQRNKELLNRVDSAVLQNADNVRSVVFSNDIAILTETLYDLEIQLKSESWGHLLDAENRIRNKFTNTLYSKYSHGVSKLQRIDPLNADVFHFKFKRYLFFWKKIFQMWWFIFLMFLILPFVLIEKYNELPPLTESYDRLWVWIAIGAYIILRLLISNFYQIRAIINRKETQGVSPIIADNVEGTTETTELLSNTHIEETHDIPNEEVPFSIEQKLSIHEETIHKLRALWQKYGGINNIMNRGFSYSRNSCQKDILIVGFNPIESSLRDKEHSFVFPHDLHGFWGNINRMLESKNIRLRYNAAYLDLFSFKENNHAKAMEEIILNPQLFDYVVEQIKLTQSIIEEIIRPKVIIIIDQDEWAFWGKLPEFTWMGYEFESIDILNGFEVARIIGYKDADDRINKLEMTNTNLHGSVVIFCTREGVKKYPTPEEIKFYLTKAY